MKGSDIYVYDRIIANLVLWFIYENSYSLNIQFVYKFMWLEAGLFLEKLTQSLATAEFVRIMYLKPLVQESST